MSTESPEKKSQLLSVLREGVSVIQMILFKEVRTRLPEKYPQESNEFHSMLAGAITNDLFGTPNREERFETFRKEHQGILEQEVIAFPGEFPDLLNPLTDALRVQTLCDHQEGSDSSAILARAEEMGYLQTERDVPLPTAFMTLVREIGEQHNLIIPPAPIDAEHDKIIH